MVRLNAPVFIVLNKPAEDFNERVSDLAPMPWGVVVLLVIVVALAIGAAAIGRLTESRPSTPATISPAPPWTCWSTEANYCKH
jgi:ABC-type glucose/galactose transport system permease subunit